MTHWRIETFETLDSTSDLCLARAAAGEAAGFAVLAGVQTGGRGRAGRSWQSPPGNLFLSVLLRPAARPEDAGLFSLMAGLVLAESLQRFLPPPVKTMLKWPNDVLIGSAKLGGVLIEAGIETDRIGWMVIGFGANLAHAPGVPGRAVTSLAAHGGAANPNQVMREILARLDRWLNPMEPETLRAAWLGRAHAPGTPVTVDGGRVSGSFAGLTAEGSLLLERAGGVETIRAGEIALG
ncbi:MAG TPA: biotin--[acetyl-CoA-carboxylase] ligase [Acetobacteraceae bacterium]|nr:biotin--[acetyl-CoA-carboxylase] ligase [Acetobacteraceae bacterium]